MDFGKLFDAYTNDSSIDERKNVLSKLENPALDIANGIQNILNNKEHTDSDDYDFEDSSDLDDDYEDVELESEPEPIIPEKPIDPDVLNVLSDLDTLETNPEKDPIQNPEPDNNPSAESSINNFDNDNNEEILPENSILDDNDIDFGTEEPPALSPENTDNDSLEEKPTDESDTLDINDFIDNFDTETESGTENFEDFEFHDKTLEHEEMSFDNPDGLDHEFEIELPEELTASTPDFIENLEDEEEILDNYDLDPNTNKPSFDPLPPEEENELKETAYETISPHINFQNLEENTKTENISQLNLNEQQMFVIREKINSFVDKDLRFLLRGIILEPELHREYYDQLISMLMIDAPEHSVAEFLEEHSETDDMGVIPISSITTESRSTFFADDVANFEQFKIEFAQTIQKIFLYSAILILSATIFWTGLAQPFRIHTLFEKGLKEIEKNNYYESESLFAQASQISGKPKLKWYVKYGCAYEKKKLVNLAEDKYKIALQIAPKDIATGIHISDFYTNLGPKFYPEAMKIMKNLSSIHPNNFEAWDYYGSLYIKDAEIQDNIEKRNESLYQAAEIYNTFILNNIKNIAPYYKMIEIYIKIGNTQQINKILKLIQQLNPKYLNVDILTKLAAYYTDRRKLTESEQVFRQLIPFIDKYKNKFGSLQNIMQKNYNINSSSLSNIIGESFYEFARYKMLSSDIPGAAAILTNVIKLNPNNYKGYNLLGETFLAMPHNEKFISQAKTLFEQAIEINPQYYKPYINLGHIYFYWDQEFPDPAQAYNKALYNYKQGNFFIPEDHKNYLLNYNLGWLEYENKNEQDALNLWSDIYKFDPSNPTISYALGSLLFKIGNPQLAQIELTKSSETLNKMAVKIPEPDPKNRRHKEIFTQLSKVCNNIGVIYANYALSNPGKQDAFETQALLHFYNAKDKADQLNFIYNIAEYNIGVLTRQNIKNRKTEFDNTIPKQTSLENINSELKQVLLDEL